MSDTITKPLVSVIIPTLNSGQFLNTTLKSVFAQTYNNLEVIVIDGGSKDKTLEIALKYKIKHFEVTSGRSFQKNYGAKKSSGKYLYFVDSDFVLDPGIISQAVDLIENEGFDLIEVHNTSDPTVSFWAKVRKFERDMLIGDKYTISPRFLPKRLFELVNGFNESMVAGEDYDIFNRLMKNNYKIGFTDRFETHIGEPKSIIDIIRKNYFYGKTLQIIGKNQASGVITFWQKSPLKPAYIKNWMQFIKHPILTIGLLIYLVTKYIAGLCGFIVGTISKEKFMDKTF